MAIPLFYSIRRKDGSVVRGIDGEPVQLTDGMVLVPHFIYDGGPRPRQIPIVGMQRAEAS